MHIWHKSTCYLGIEITNLDLQHVLNKNSNHLKFKEISNSGCENLHQLNLHRHVDGEEHIDGVCLPQDQGVLQGETWVGVPSGGHEVGGQG